MIKKLISLALASISTLTLAGCGATGIPDLPNAKKMGDGTDNKTGLGGYWWTHIDRSGTSKVSPDTGKVDPTNTTTVPAKLLDSIGPNNGIADGAFHIKGELGPAPVYNATDKFDPYWDAFYGKDADSRYSPGVCGTFYEGGKADDGTTDLPASSCGEMKYPSVGMGFGFKSKNAPLGDDATGLIGVSFKLKLGASDDSSGDFPMTVAMVMDISDVPDPTYDDQFGTKFANLPQTGKPTSSDANTPICTFPGTVVDVNGKEDVKGSGDKSCFMNMINTGTFALYNRAGHELNKDGFVTYCMTWSDFNKPAFGGLDKGTPPVDEKNFKDYISHLTKMQFDAYKPDTPEKARKFEFYVDDVYLLDDKRWQEHCTGGDVVKTDTPS
jgi:hypothetical protein